MKMKKNRRFLCLLLAIALLCPAVWSQVAQVESDYDLSCENKQAHISSSTSKWLDHDDLCTRELLETSQTTVKSAFRSFGNKGKNPLSVLTVQSFGEILSPYFPYAREIFCKSNAPLGGILYRIISYIHKKDGYKG